MSKIKSHRLEVERNAEGSKLAYLTPINEDGELQIGHRIFGPKPWGGSVTLATVDIQSTDLAKYIKKYAPEIVEQLRDSP